MMHELSAISIKLEKKLDKKYWLKLSTSRPYSSNIVVNY